MTRAHQALDSIKSTLTLALSDIQNPNEILKLTSDDSGLSIQETTEKCTLYETRI